MWDCLIRFLCHVLLINIKQIISWIVKFQQKRVNSIKTYFSKCLRNCTLIKMKLTRSCSGLLSKSSLTFLTTKKGYLWLNQAYKLNITYFSSCSSISFLMSSQSSWTPDPWDPYPLVLGCGSGPGICQHNFQIYKFALYSVIFLCGLALLAKSIFLNFCVL